ncbi:hypothetical protein B0H11DRAFT_2239732 [Mycena galericulata]|nr:hypothetical protein B0H11DRAFT_2239732 [Mycena galericulata]
MPLTDNQKILAKYVPEPPKPSCPNHRFHAGTPYLAARASGEPERWGQWAWACIPMKSEKTPSVACNDGKMLKGPRLTQEQIDKIKPQVDKEIKEAQVAKNKSPPKKKTPLRIALDAVVTAYKAAFPEGVSGPGELSATKSAAIDKALERLNEFYPIDVRTEPNSSSVAALRNGDSVATPSPDKKGKAKASGALEVATPSSNKGKSKASSDIVGTPSPSRVKGKGRDRSRRDTTRAAFLQDEAAGIEADQYDSDVYDIDDSERALINAVVYATANTDPLCQKLRLRSKSNFEFKNFRLAKSVGLATRAFERFSLSSFEFTEDRVRDTLNLARRGNIIIYRLKSLTNAECPGIEDWMTQACNSAYENGCFEDDDSAPAGGHPVPVTPVAGPSTVRSPSTPSKTTSLKRKFSRAGSAHSGSSVFLDEETARLEEEERDDRKMRKFQSSLGGSVTRSLEQGEIILVEDSEPEDSEDSDY